MDLVSVFELSEQIGAVVGIWPGLARPGLAWLDAHLLSFHKI